MSNISVIVHCIKTW